jgi:2-aminoadipate transaminase
MAELLAGGAGCTIIVAPIRRPETMAMSAAVQADPPPPRPAFARWLTTTNEVTRTFLAAGEIPDLINLAGGLPAPEIYPTAEIAEIARRQIEEHPRDALGYGPIEGLPELRDALAARLGSPALRLSRENVLVTTSGMQGLDLLGKVLLEEGSIIAGQFPTYLGALDAWRPRAPGFRNMELEAAGFDPVAALSGVQFAYTVPNFSNPTGRMVGPATRQALVDAAHRTGTWLVEDDPYGSLQYDGERLPRLIELSARRSPGQAYDGPVIYMGTLSKQIAPGLRIGWIIAAREMIEALTIAKQGSDMCTSGVTQRTALAALEAGLIERIQPATVELYRRRRDALCAAMAEHLSAWFAWDAPVGGMFVWAVAHDPTLDTDALLPHALAAGVCVSPSSVFDASGRNRRAIRLNFTLNEADRLAEGVRRLAAALAAMQAGRR